MSVIFCHFYNNSCTGSNINHTSCLGISGAPVASCADSYLEKNHKPPKLNSGPSILILYYNTVNRNRAIIPSSILV